MHLTENMEKRMRKMHFSRSQMSDIQNLWNKKESIKIIKYGIVCYKKEMQGYDENRTLIFISGVNK